MCGRYILVDGVREMTAFKPLKDLELDEDFDLWVGASYNISPGQRVPVIYQPPEPADSSPPRLGLFSWQFIAPWSRNGKSKYSTINARAESIADSKLYGPALRRKRCLVPTNGYYEWTRNFPGNAGAKQPILLGRPQNRLFFMAGLWSTWTEAATGEAHHTFAVITTAAAPSIAKYHDRMPALLLEDPELKEWLAGPGKTPGGQAAWQSRLLRPRTTVPEGEEIEVTPVSTRVNSPANNDPAIIEPVKLPPEDLFS